MQGFEEASCNLNQTLSGYGHSNKQVHVLLILRIPTVLINGRFKEKLSNQP